MRPALLALLLTVPVAVASVATAPVASAQTAHDPPQRVAYRHGAALVASGQPDAAYASFADAARLAELRGDTAVGARARRVLAQMDYNHGARLAWMQRVQDALPYFEAGLANDPTNPRNALGYGHALARLGREDDALAALRMARDLAERRGDDVLVRTARRALRDRFLTPLRPYLDRADVSLPAPLGETMLARLALADSNAVADDETRYLRARALLGLGRAADALALADAFLAHHQGTQDAAAPFQYVRGEALRTLRRSAEAQAAYRAALYGRIVPWAEDRLRAF